MLPLLKNNIKCKVNNVPRLEQSYVSYYNKIIVVKRNISQKHNHIFKLFYLTGSARYAAIVEVYWVIRHIQLSLNQFEVGYSNLKVTLNLNSRTLPTSPKILRRSTKRAFNRRRSPSPVRTNLARVAET